MKRILTIILLLVSFVGLGQNNNFPNKPTQGSTKTSNQFLGQVSAQRGVSGGIFRDTIAANDSAYVKSKSFNIIHTTSDNNTWYRSSDTLRWVLFATTNSNCGGTRLIDGSITWSGVGYIFNATVLHYGIICGLYTSDTTTLTVSPSDPTYPRIDVFYADTSGNVGIITGTPSPTPVKPSVNPLSQIEVSFVYVPAGSVTPPQTATIIYNENIEWASSSNVPSIDFLYPTNPYDGLVSTYFSSMASGSYISYQNGSVLNINNYQYLKFYFRRNSALGSDPASTLVLDFYNGNTLITNSLFINDGAYGYDASVIGSYQLIVVPISSFTFADSLFDKLYITNTTGSLSSCQLDKIYLLGSVPPPPVISNSWVRPGNANTNPATDYVGTSDSTLFNIGTNGQKRLGFKADGITPSSDTTDLILVFNPVTLDAYYIHQPSIYALGCLKIYDSTSSGITRKYIRDTCSGGGGWSLTGNAGTVAGTNFIGTTDDVDFVGKRNGIRSLLIASANTGLGYSSLSSISSGFGNIGIGSSALASISTESNNIAIGNSALAGSSGSNNTAVGAQAGLFMSTGSNNTLIGYNSVQTANVSGSYNTLIGASTDLASLTTKYGVGIGNGAIPKTYQLRTSDSIRFMQFKGLSLRSSSTLHLPLIDTTGNGDMSLQLLNLTNAITGVLPIANGGTNNGSLAVTAGSLIYADGTKLISLPIGTAAQHLVGGTIPQWVDTAAGGGSSQWTDTLSSTAITYTGDAYVNGQLNADSVKQGGYAVKPYKVYVAILHQSSTGAPTATLLENSTGTTFTWVYNATGSYAITADSGTPFTDNKTVVFITPTGGDASVNLIHTAYNTTTNLSIYTGDTFGANADNILDNTGIEIRIYP